LEGKTSFSSNDVLELRQRAERAADPMGLLAVFASLRLKEHFDLCACFTPPVFEGRVGYIWATSLLCGHHEMAAVVNMCELPRPIPIENSCLDGLEMTGSSNLLRPARAVDNVMEAIEGNGTPRSFLEASIFAREAAEFLPVWHGVVWSDHTILGDDSRKGIHDADDDYEKLSAEWDWLCDKPSNWNPVVVCKQGIVTVEFYSYPVLVEEAIYRHRDTYKPNTYMFEWDIQIIGRGGDGIIV